MGFGGRGQGRRLRGIRPRPGLIALSAILLLGATQRLAAQAAASDARDDADAALIDALLATPSALTPAPQTNIFATSPGLEEQAPSPRFTFNVLTPVYFNSNPESASVGSVSTAAISPVGSLSWAAPVFDLPLRLSANLRAESDRFTGSSGPDLDKLAGTLRLQAIDPNNDQGFSPYLVYAPRMDLAPTFAQEIATRQDLNLGFNKIFNFDANFQAIPAAGNTRASTAWSFGLTFFAQRRFRDPTPSSYALYVIPSLSYVIDEQWNVSLGVETLRRWFDSNGGVSRADWLVEPIATLEFVLPASWFGAEGNARLFGQPALDFQTSYERASSSFSISSFSTWKVGAALKTGWRF
ncbi:hypothetical protein SIN04_05730 [Methylocella tundrae]|nr:hypothetical protein SIN04_05730 [Methylocella tundrae]